MADTNQYGSALALLKANLGYYGCELDSAVESYLQSLLEYSERALADSGVYLYYGDTYDDQLLAMYAAWVYRKGAKGDAKPPMLQTAIRNRQVSRALDNAEITEAMKA